MRVLAFRKRLSHYFTGKEFACILYIVTEKNGRCLYRLSQPFCRPEGINSRRGNDPGNGILRG